jgi:hypothetical protein
MSTESKIERLYQRFRHEGGAEKAERQVIDAASAWYATLSLNITDRRIMVAALELYNAVEALAEIEKNAMLAASEWAKTEQEPPHTIRTFIRLPNGCESILCTCGWAVSGVVDAEEAWKQHTRVGDRKDLKSY